MRRGAVTRVAGMGYSAKIHLAAHTPWSPYSASMGVVRFAFTSPRAPAAPRSGAGRPPASHSTAARTRTPRAWHYRLPHLRVNSAASW